MFLRFSFLLLSLFFASSCSNPRNISPLALQSAFVNVKNSHPVATSSHSSHYLRLIANRLSDALPRKAESIKPQIFIVRSQEPIAVAGPTGEILLSTRFLSSLETESQFMFVLAHELSHSILNHAAQLTESQDDYNQISYRHAAEQEADRLAVEIMITAGYDPRQATRALAFVYMFQGIQADEKTHPDFAERVYAIQSSITDSGWLPPGIESSRSFYSFKKNIL